MHFAKLARLLLGLTGLSSCTTSLRQPSTARTQRPWVIAHQGSQAHRPGNQLSSFRHAMNHDIDSLELDLHVTQDRQLIVYHHPALDPKTCTDAQGRAISSSLYIHKMPLAEVKKYLCGTRPHPLFPQQKAEPEPLSTLDEFLDLYLAQPNRALPLFIEIKHDDVVFDTYWPIKDFVALTLDTLRARKILDRVVIESFSPEVLREIKKREASVPVCYLLRRFTYSPNVWKNIREMRPEWVSPRMDHLTADDVRKIYDLELKIAPWTLNTPKEWAQASEWGTDGIFTDDAEGLIRFQSQP
jgi:glycerophosphoryl diester phosphodiesterase